MMAANWRAVLVKALGVLSVAGTAVLTGCGTGTLAGPSPTPGFKIKGNVHGGPLPIQGATIRLMTTASNGVWQSSTGSYKGTATTQLQTTSNQYGYFTFPETGWSCPAGQFAYVTVSGGHTASQSNNNVVQVGVIGSCSDKLANQTEYDNVNVFVSELSTIAAAYALRDFITIDDNTGAGVGQQLVNITAPAANNSTTAGCTGTGNTGANQMTCTPAGLAHAFGNAYNLVDSVTYTASAFPSGNARTTIPGNAKASVPQSEINTMGNILQVCVDSGGGTVSNYSTYVPGGSGSSRCGDLFYYATAPGSTTPPTNTMQVAMNMASYPTHNVDQLFTLQPQVKFFTPTMTSDTLSGNSSQLMAYTLSVFYTGTGIANESTMVYPTDVVLDENDNVFVSYSNNGTIPQGAVNMWDANGTGLFAGAQNALISNPASMATDALGNLWLTNDAGVNGNLLRINTPTSGGTLGAIGTTVTVRNGYAAGVAADMSNNIWVSRDAGTQQSLFQYTVSSSYTSTTFNTNPRLAAASKRIFVDYNQNVLGVTSNTDTNNSNPSTTATQVFLFPYATGGAGTTLHTVTLNTSGAYGIAMSSGALANNGDNAYIPLSKEFDTEKGLSNGQMTANGAGSNTSASSTNGTYSAPMGVVMDGAGNFFWPDFSSSGQVFWMVSPDTGDVSKGTLYSFFPCYPINGQCYSSVSSYLRGIAADSSGAIWYTADSSTGVLVQTFGMAAPTYPLLSYARAGIVVH